MFKYLFCPWQPAGWIDPIWVCGIDDMVLNHLRCGLKWSHIMLLFCNVICNVHYYENRNLLFKNILKINILIQNMYINS